MRQTLLLRGDGGPPPVLSCGTAPDHPADFTTQLNLSTHAPLIYRLTGDRNPLHIDPEFARRAGFERPIIHGLGVYGTIAAALCRVLGRRSLALTKLACRFSGIVMPGESLHLRIWTVGRGFRFDATVAGRRALDQGVLELKS